MQQHILIVDPDLNWATKVQTFLQLQQYHVSICSTAEEAKALFNTIYPCMVLLELDLPRQSGEQLCEWIRSHQTVDVSIIAVTNRHHVEDKINVLTIGADHYLTKPIDVAELFAHMQAVLRRTGLFCQKIIHNGLCIKPRKGEVLLNGEKIYLTKHEFMLLYYLMDHPNQIISRAALMDQLYPTAEKDVMDRTIDAHIKKLRAKIEKNPKQPERIVTIRGIGYTYIPKEK